MMKFNPDIHHRRSIRLKEYDYSQAGAYFVTLCTHERECLFGEIVDGEMRMNQFGRIIAAEWIRLAELREEIELGESVVMPNHFHGVLIFKENIALNTVGAIHELPLQNVPHGWEVKTFGDVFNIVAGGDVDPKRTISYQDQTHCFPIYSNALTACGLYGYCSYADHQAGSITVTARGTLGFANFRDHAYTAIGRVLVLQPKQESDGRFLAEVINNCIKFAIESTGVPQLTAPQISAYKLTVPPLPEQTAIATILSDMDTEIAALETKLAKTRSLKQGMMHNLLTGRIRLI
jgi:hypothetical protein